MIAREAYRYLSSFPEPPNCVSFCWYALAHPIASRGLAEALQFGRVNIISGVENALFHEFALQGKFMLADKFHDGESAGDHLLASYRKYMFDPLWSKAGIKFGGCAYLSSQGDHVVAVTSLLNRQDRSKRIRILDVGVVNCERIVNLDWLNRRTKDSPCDDCGSRGFSCFTIDPGKDIINMALKAKGMEGDLKNNGAN